MQKEQIAPLIHSYFEALQTFNAEAWVAHFAEDGILYDPVGNPPSHAHTDYQKFFGLLSKGFETLELAQDQVFIAGNGAAIKWTMKVLGRNGKSGMAEGISVFEFNEAGKIKQVSSYWDDAALMAQIRG